MTDQDFREKMIAHAATQTAYQKMQAEQIKKLEITISKAFKGIDLQKMQGKVDTHSKHIAIIYGIGIAALAVWQAITRKLFGGG